MDNTAKKLKSIIKNPDSGKPPFGSNPMDPWSTKVNISEASLDDYLSSRGINPRFVSKDTKISHAKSGEFQKWKNDRKMVGESSESDLLARYLSSRGINPKYVTKDVKIAHSKSNEFQKWKNDHITEETDKKDMVCFDIPLLIRVLEFTREDMKSDIELHNMVERLINMRETYPLTMREYDEITQKLVKENHIAIAMGKMLDDESGMVLTQIEELERGCAMIRSYIGKDYEKQLPAWVQAKITLATDYMSTVGNYLVSKNENVKEAHDPWQDKHFGPTKVIKQKYHVKTDTKSYNVKADNEEHAHKLVTKHAPGSKIVSIEHKGRMMEEVEQADESYNGPRGDKLIAVSHAAYDAGDKAKSKRAHTLAMKAGEKYRSNPVNRDKAISHIMSGANKDYTSGKTRTNDSVELDGEVMSEVSDATLSSYKEKAKKSADSLHSQGQYKKSANRWLNVMKATGKQIDKMQKENTMDSLAATQAPCDGANTPDNVAPKDKNKKLIQMSKSARMIKSLYKKHNMKEETYDFEKDDKSSQSKPYGKKPTFTATDKYKNAGENKPEARAVMKGGTTLTGQPRDMVEIDPSMKNRPDRPDVFDKGNPKKSPV